MLALDKAMASLESRDSRQHDVVMLRFFAGLTVEQAAEVLDVSAATVKSDWSYARAWLLREVERARGSTHGDAGS
jgi:RNA polymerase sigma factor (sigma-70 family)